MTPLLRSFILLSLLAAAGCKKRSVTFSEHIAPIIYENCSSCHRPGQSAPFSLLSYADARQHATDIAKVTASGYMPPWLPQKGCGDFTGERHLSPDQIALLQRWVAAGALEGNAALAPKPPSFVEGWQLGRPDLVVTLPRAYRLAPEGRDLYRNFVIPAPLRGNQFVRALEFHPRNRAVHHVRIKLDSTRQSRRMDEEDPEPGFPGMRTPARFPPGHMTTWVPGQTSMPVDEGLQWPMEKENDIVLEVHLQRTGKEELIQPEIGLYFTNTPPSGNAMLIGLSSQQIDIPAGDANYLVERRAELPVNALALTILPHMHYLGKEIEAFAILPNGERACLLHIPQWDFNWQGEYHYRDPVLLPAGTIVTMRARYDNSAENVRNPNQPPRRVVYGPQSTDEMCELWLQLLVENEADLASLQQMQKQLNETETIAFYESQLRENPNNAPVHTALGKVLGPAGRLPEALEHFRTALQLDPNQVEAHYYLGLSFLTSQELDRARESFEAALRVDPGYGRAHDGLGLVALRLNKTEEAIKHFRRALEINPDDPAALSNLERLGEPQPVSGR